MKELCRKVVAEVAYTVVARQVEGGCLPLEDYSCRWVGWTQAGSPEERKKAKTSAPESRKGYGKWGFISSVAQKNMQGILEEVLQKMGGEDAAASQAPSDFQRAGRYHDEGPVVVTYLPQDFWEKFGINDGKRKIGFLMWLEKATGEFSVNGTVVPFCKNVVSSGGEDKQMLLIKGGVEWMLSAKKHAAGLDTPVGKTPANMIGLYDPKMLPFQAELNSRQRTGRKSRFF